MAIGGMLSVGILYRHVTVFFNQVHFGFILNGIGCTSNHVVRTHQGAVSTSIVDRYVTVLMKGTLHSKGVLLQTGFDCFPSWKKNKIRVILRLICPSVCLCSTFNMYFYIF